MHPPVRLFHYGTFQPLWQQPGLIQFGPRLHEGPGSIQVTALGVDHLNAALLSRGCDSGGVLVH